MTTAALKERTFTERKRNVSLSERIAVYFDEYSAEIACGLLAISGNTDAGRVYQMLRK